MYFLVYNKCNELVLFSQIKGYKNSGNGIELPLEMFYALWILKAFVYNVPVYNVPIIFNVFRTSVLGVQIVSVFPDINCQHGFLLQSYRYKTQEYLSPCKIDKSHDLPDHLNPLS